MLSSKYPSADWQVLSDGLKSIHESPADGFAIYYNMAAWRLANDMRDYIYFYSDADIDGALDTYFIPGWEVLFEKEDTVPSSLFEVSYPDDNVLSLKAYPVPSAEITTFAFTIHQACKVKLAVYDLQGKEVEILIADIGYQPGEYSFSWKNKEIKSGIYFARMNASNEIAVIKIIK